MWLFADEFGFLVVLCARFLVVWRLRCFVGFSWDYLLSCLTDTGWLLIYITFVGRVFVDLFPFLLVFGVWRLLLFLIGCLLLIAACSLTFLLLMINID